MLSLGRPSLNYTPGSTIGNVANLYRNAHELTCNRMRNLEMDTSHVTVNYVTKLFRQLNQHELESPVVFRELYDMLHNNLVVSDVALMKKLKLLLYNPTTRVSHWFYIRSWQYSLQDFKTVLDDFTLDGTYTSIVDLWRAQLEDRDLLESVCIRYIGQTLDPESRQLSDDEIQRKNGFMANFFRKTKSLGIEARSYNVMIFEEELLTLDGRQDPHYENKSRDLFEQVVISMFGLDLLLNSQPGGITQKFTPSERYRQEYLALEPQFFTKLNLYMTRYPENLDPTINFLTYAGARNRIQPWLMSIMQFHQMIASQKDVICQGELQDAYMESLMDLAAPVGSVFGHHLMVMVGDAITERAFYGAHQITDSESSNTAYVLCDMLSRLEAWERNDTVWNPLNIKNLTGVFPFINVIPWLANPQRTFSYGLQQTRRYLNIVKPIITITFSRVVTSGAFSNFIHQWGLESKINLVDVIGVPRLVSYANDDYLYNDSLSGPPRGSSTIVIPHFHPGYDKYTMRLPGGPRKLIDMTWQITLCIGEIAIDVINEMKLEDERRVVIARIMTLISRGSAHLHPKLHHLYRRLDELKLEYTRNEHAARKEYPKSTRTHEDNQISALLGAMTRLNQFENAVGEPGSAERTSQVNRLWKMNIPVYHIGISRDAKEEWFQWANAIPRDKNIHMSSMQLKSEQLSPVEGFSVGRLNALRTFAPNTPQFQDESWVYNPALRQQILSN
ncbi:unnamed protein product [Mucor fragilis]